MTVDEKTHPLRIFLCHSSGDKPIVRDLYRRLKSDGFVPWLDEEDLLAGQDWEIEIPATVRACDVVLVCLSKSSITKSGFVQKEIKLALDVADEKPEGTIFMIPVRIEEIDVPARLRRWQWVNLFQENGYQQLVRALKARANPSNATATPAISSLHMLGSQATESRVLKQNQDLRRESLSLRAYALIALSGLLIGLGLLFFYVYEVPKLINGGVQNQVFYILLIPWSLSSAAFLFGSMRSFALLTHKHVGTVLEFGGPIVLFGLVLFGGFKLVPTPLPFDATVRVHSQNGSLITKGKIIIEFDDLRREEIIAPNGEANFKGVPAKFKGMTVRIFPDVEDHHVEWLYYKLSSNTLDLVLEIDSSNPKSGTKGGLKNQSAKPQPYAQAEEHNYHGLELDHKGDKEGAKREYREALQIDPSYYFAYNNLGTLLRDEGKLDAAIAEFQSALRIKSDYALAHSNLGLTFEKKADFPEALQHMNRAHELEPGNPRFTSHLERLKEELDNSKKITQGRK